MQKEEAIAILDAHRDEILGQGVKALYLFGSVARNEAKPDSDVDVLVELDPDHPIGIFAFLDLKQYLEGILGHPVDLATPDALKRQLKDHILAEAIRAA